MSSALDPVINDRPLIVPRSPVVRQKGRTSDASLEAAVLGAYDDYERDLHAFARALVRDPEAAEGVVSEAFMRLIREMRADRAPEDVRGWLYRVSANLVLSRGRRLQTAKRFAGLWE